VGGEAGQNRQKDKDARWTKKHGKSLFGYKTHVNVDRTHKLIRRYAVTDAAEHDSRQFDGLMWPAVCRRRSDREHAFALVSALSLAKSPH
jgi:Transposase DDE domain